MYAKRPHQACLSISFSAGIFVQKEKEEGKHGWVQLGSGGMAE
jgi:hypothetical protein